MQPAGSSTGFDLVRPEPAQVCHAFHADEGEADPSEHGGLRVPAHQHFGKTYEADLAVLISMPTPIP